MDTNYLIDRDYVVRLSTTPTGCVGNFPAQALKDDTSDKQDIEFTIDWEKETVLVEGSEFSYNTNVPHYLIRTFITHSISTFCNSINYDGEAIIFEVDNLAVDEDYWLEYCFGDKMDLSDYEMAFTITNLIASSMADGWDEKYEKLAGKEGVLEGYEFMKNMLNGGK